ncbi:DUF2683 family protein [Epilithonimonas hungarica]|uniref:Uncharacterized protein n=1 Tax=Epilithonimonas hungarica TaxID=454006 RepID=A0A1G7P612_9FLAO|nr:DUF2683 family protein [Epilithonimonas hungarica]SDF81029.1 hypothetical protein SAMN05421825_2183 [Epilithonimonas hungarica]
MNAFIIHPANQEEASLLESLLKRMKFSFEKVSEEKIAVSPEEIQSINRGIDEANENKLTNSSDVHKKARELCSK